MAPTVLSIDIACPPGELFTLGKQAFVFRGLADADADDDNVKLTHDTIMNQSGPRFPVPRAAVAAALTAELTGSAVIQRRADQRNGQGWARQRGRGLSSRSAPGAGHAVKRRSACNKAHLARPLARPSSHSVARLTVPCSWSGQIPVSAVKDRPAGVP